MKQAYKIEIRMTLRLIETFELKFEITKFIVLFALALYLPPSTGRIPKEGKALLYCISPNAKK